MQQENTASYRINCFCEDYSELDALDLIRIRYELKNSEKFGRGICYLEKAIEAFSSCNEFIDDSHSLEQEKCDRDNVQSELLTPNQYSVESPQRNSA